MTAVQCPSPELTSTPPPPPTPSISMLSPAASTSPTPPGLTPGWRSPRRQPLYSWQYTPSPQIFSETRTHNSSPSSSSPSTTRKRSRSARPGTLTSTAILGYPRTRLRSSSPLPQDTLPHSNPPFSSSPVASRSKRQCRQTDTPSAP